MKKLLLLATLLIATSSSFAQVKIKAGVNVPSFKSEHFVNKEKRDVVDNNNIGFYAGINYEHKLNEKFSFDADLIYSTYSYNGKVSFFAENKFQTISIPVTFNYYIFDKFKIGVGGSVSNYIKAESIYKSETNQTLPSEFDDIFENTTLKIYDKINYGIHAGASYNIYNNLFIDVRYNIGLGNMYKDEYKDEYKLSQNNLQLGLSYKF